MRDQTTWIKLDRNIAEWRWYQDANTFRVFIHLLINANIRQHDYQNETVGRGALAVSIGNIASSLNISYDQVRTALKHLEKTGEITIKKGPKYLVISIVGYDRYQDGPKEIPSESQGHPKDVPSTSQQSKNIRIKEYKKPPYIPPEEDEEFGKVRMMLLGRRPDDKG